MTEKTLNTITKSPHRRSADEAETYWREITYIYLHTNVILRVLQTLLQQNQN